MIEVTLITNYGSGLPTRIPVADGTTLEKFLEVSFEGDPDDFIIRVRANGASIEAHSDYVLQDNDRISFTHKKIEGAALMKGPGTNEQQVVKLREKVGQGGVNEAQTIADGYHPNVVALAYKISRTKKSGNDLPKSVTKLLDKLPEGEAEAIRDKLVNAKIS